ncbi:TetR family transcriptional regulator [Agrobacterium vitis]|uniref:TetR family transcriptional regulator n=2 Tax=Agrobacterium vitis TaxID=373 RepID=A0A6L6VJW1_AGRVI|nr:TetR family transcriptional regulator [Agrobacterium vitis]
MILSAWMHQHLRCIPTREPMRTKSETKRRQILTIAGDLFREHGFGAVNMAQIAASVGGSKSTLYNHFPTKEALFEAYMIEAGRERFAALADSDQASDNVEKSLTAYARAYLRLLLSPEVLSINRLVIAEAPRFQELGRIFYQNGPRATLDQIEKKLEHLVERQALAIPDIAMAALQFKAVAEAGIYEHCLWGLIDRPNDAQIETAAKNASTTIMTLYSR